ncbi:aminodeoxychorismate lyase [Niallia sp. 03190]|uniref:aminodeoxychorismate lyase n=1 Tax=Niallia sp. 03190 TaxID=3458061 RepID=UPI0040445D9F
MYIYINEKVVKQEEAVISVFDHGFMYGLGLFETFRIYEGHPFLLEDHLQRLNHGLKRLNIERVFTREEVNSIIQVLLQKNDLKNAYIRFNVSAGSGAIGLQTTPYTNPNIVMYMKPLPAAGRMVEKKGRILAIPRNTPEGDERLKSHHYLNNIFAKREIGTDAEIEGIFLTKEQHLAEGVTTNLFWIKKDVLYTPSLDTGILNGITRQFIMAYAKKMGMTVEEGFYAVEHMLQAEEVFATNSIQEIIPLKSIDAHLFNGAAGKVVALFHKNYRKLSSSLWSIKEMGEK